MEKKVKQWALKYGYDDVEYLGRWKEFDVYDLVFNEVRVTGFPLVALVKDKKLRVSTPEESLEIMDFFRENGNDKA